MDHHSTSNRHIQPSRSPANISLHPHDCILNPTGAILRKAIGELIYEQRLDLDRLLVELWELRSIRPKITNGGTPGNYEKKGVMIDYVQCLLPEITKRGIIDLDGCHLGS